MFAKIGSSKGIRKDKDIHIIQKNMNAFRMFFYVR